MERAAMVGDPIHKKMAELRMACQTEIRIRRQRYEAAVSSFRDSLHLVRSTAQENLANREKLGKLKDYLRNLETDLGNALTAKACKKAKHTAIAESLSTSIARTEQLEQKVQDQRARKDEYTALISQQLLILESLEEKSNEDMTETKNIEEVIMWYKRVLGFRTEGGEGVKFVFNNINMNNPDEEYAFSVKLDGDTYHLITCDPFVEDVNALVKDLNKTNEFFKFVRIMREKFQAAASIGVLPIASSVTQASSSVTTSSPAPVLVDIRNKIPIEGNVAHSQPTKARLNPHKRIIQGQVAIQSPESISTVRRSPRFVGKKRP